VTVILCSCDVRAAESERHGIPAGVTKALMPQSCISRRWGITFVSNEGRELTGKCLKIALHDKDEAAMLASGRRLPNARVVEAHIVPLAEMLMGNDAGRATLGHLGRMVNTDMDMGRGYGRLGGQGNAPRARSHGYRRPSL
jgi:hypothetical protein